MPLKEVELHPFLKIGESITASRMIVGTFPVYSITRPRNSLKAQVSRDNGNLQFFYGSSANQFWSWYQRFIDNTVNRKCNKSILASLKNHGIAISDVIVKCERKESSFRDSDLRAKDWNMRLANVIENQIDKILCTSKSQCGAMGWLRDRILIPSGFQLCPGESSQMHKQILESIQHSNHHVKPIAQTLIKNNKMITIISLPSPGSPYRRLVDFGYNAQMHHSETYLDNYLRQVFQWF